MEEVLFLSIDQSTTATKIVLFNENLTPLKIVSKWHRQYYPKPGWVEHDPVEIVENLKIGIREVASSVRLERIVAVSITNQRETVVAWDKSGRPVYNAIVWQCLRGKELCDRLRKQGYEDLIKERTGLRLDPYFSATKIAWIFQNLRDVEKAANKGEVLVGTIDSWLIWNLTEGQVHATDYSNASRTMLLNVESLNWDEDILSLFHIPVRTLPVLKPSDAVFGYTNLFGLSSRPIPIVGVMGDSSASLFGQAGLNPGDAKATYGTGTSVMINTAKVRLNIKSGVVSVGWFRKGECTYVIEGNIHSSGDTIRWLIDPLGLITENDNVEALAASLDDNEGVYLVPAFSGLGAPYWNSDARALVCGMSRRTGKAHVVRAALESIAYQVYDLLLALTEESRISVSSLRADGGATKNQFLMQFQSDLLGIPVLVSDVMDCSARGVALMAAESLLGVDPERLAPTFTRYEPRMSQEKKEKLISGWHSAIRKALL